MLKVLTINTHKLIAPLTRKYTLLALRAALHEIDADLVFLQEMRGEHPKKHPHAMGSPIEILAEGRWPHFVYAANSIYAAGNHGNAILSKYPILQSRNINLTNHSREQRGLLWLEVENHWAEHDLNLANCHLDLTEWGRKRQLLKITPEVDKVLSENRPLILAGDFNDWNKRARGYLSHPKIEQSFKIPPKTFPSLQPLLALDRVYYSGLIQHHAQLLTGSPWTKITDHLPLYCEFEIVMDKKNSQPRITKGEK